eukprot:7412363-Lingulodinium_polyedra.AAC.1
METVARASANSKTQTQIESPQNRANNQNVTINITCVTHYTKLNAPSLGVRQHNDLGYIVGNWATPEKRWPTIGTWPPTAPTYYALRTFANMAYGHQ